MPISNESIFDFLSAAFFEFKKYAVLAKLLEFFCEPAKKVAKKPREIESKRERERGVGGSVCQVLYRQTLGGPGRYTG